MPNPLGSGWEKRAWSHLEALSGMGDVDLLLCLLPAQIRSAGPLDAVAEKCRRLLILPIRPAAQRSASRWPGMTLLRRLIHFGGPRHTLEPTAQEAVATLGAEASHPYDLTFCFRLRAYTMLDRIAGSAGLAWRRRFVDLDDIESRVLWREFLTQRGTFGPEHRLLLLADAAEARRDENAVLRHADGIGVCSALDAETIAARKPRGKVTIIPNSFAELPALPSKTAGEAARLLFLGTLSFKPNEDAILHFCTHILPLLQNRRTQPLALDIVGRGPSAAVQALAALPNVTVTGGVERVEPYYQDADVVIVPIRYGGGTRIKILEALALGRAVVSTTIGAEGLDLRPGEDILIADSPDDFAAACLRLIDDGELRTRIAQSGRERFMDTYAAGRVQKRMTDELSSILSG